MCGVLAGGVGIWNQVLDGAFAFKTLLAPTSDVQLVHITNPAANLAKALQILTTAQATPQGQARIALLAALADVPGWFDPTSPEPAADDYVTREQNQFRWSAGVDFAFIFAFRAELEARARGNPSWNTGVDYRKQLERSINRDEVMALYQQTGLNLEDDLRILESAPRIAADPHAVKYLINNIIFDGQLQLPVLTMHTTGDGLVTVEHERAYARVVHAAGKDATLRQTYVHRAGHCTFTPAETITAFQTLIHRLDTNNWGTADNPQALNLVASALGPNFNLWLVGNTPVPTAPAFMQYQPAPFLRPFDTRNVVTTDITAPRSMAGYVDSKAPLKNFLGADYLWTGQDTRPQTHRSLHGVFQFDLGGLPADAQVLEGQVQLMGGSSQYLNAGGGSWQLMLLNDSVDAGWTKLGYWQIHNAPTLGPARPTLTDQDIGSEIANTFELIPSQVGEIQSRLASSGKGSFRLDGDCTWPYGRHIFGWSAKASPSLQITYFHESFVR
ncbi:MAG: hypothetical protein A2Z04_09815 [Chloroflexi bacterium RBG_16_57_9]|nr:MAG: hypothetical protein A2Z04_09815 [Chloroflexi bacterium RBG_16_57_9]